MGTAASAPDKSADTQAESELVRGLPEKSLERLWVERGDDGPIRIAVERAMAADRHHMHILPQVFTSAGDECSSRSVVEFNAATGKHMDKLVGELDKSVLIEPTSGGHRCWSAVSLILVAELIEHGAAPEQFAHGGLTLHPHAIHILSGLGGVRGALKGAAAIGRALMIRRLKRQMIAGGKILMQMAGTCLAEGACPIPIKFDINVKVIKSFVSASGARRSETKEIIAQLRRLVDRVDNLPGSDWAKHLQERVDRLPNTDQLEDLARRVDRLSAPVISQRHFHHPSVQWIDLRL